MRPRQGFGSWENGWLSGNWPSQPESQIVSSQGGSRGHEDWSWGKLGVLFSGEDATGVRGRWTPGAIEGSEILPGTW